jgi:hypothetical protein
MPKGVGDGLLRDTVDRHLGRLFETGMLLVTIA